MKKSKVTTTVWDAAEHLETKEDMIAYLEAALDEGDPALITAVLGDIARAQGISDIATKTGLGRTSLYKALSPEGNPEFSTVLKVIKALGLELSITPREFESKTRSPIRYEESVASVHSIHEKK